MIVRSEMKALSYQDVYLVPAYSELHTRESVDLSVSFLGRILRAPWCPANMSSVVNVDICKWLSESSYPYVMHRFGDTREFVEQSNRENWKLISISVGVREADKNLIKWIVSERYRVDWITIDVAHSHSILTKEMISFIRTLYKTTSLAYPKIIAGNVATPEGVRDLTQWGADAAKVGIGGGAACSTKTQTGFHVPMFTCVQSCFEYGGSYTSPSIPIISDGGIRDNGDIAKALVARAQIVMAGSLFAACINAPGENVRAHRYLVTGEPEAGLNPNPITHKRYHGSSSEHQKGSKRHIEGFQIDIPCNGMTYAEKYQELTESLSSAVSYAGGTNLSAFKSTSYITI